MDTVDVKPLLEQLGSSIDDLEDALSPLLKSNLSAISSKLPLLDKAKLHVLTTYAIESILFSALRLNGVDAREHAVFRELTRVKQYFEKIKKAEDGDGDKKRENMSLNKDAAGRIIKHALAGNERQDRQRAEQQDREIASAAKEQFEVASAKIGSMKTSSRASRKRKAGVESPVAPSPASFTSIGPANALDIRQGEATEETPGKERRKRKKKSGLPLDNPNLTLDLEQSAEVQEDGGITGLENEPESTPQSNTLGNTSSMTSNQEDQTLGVPKERSAVESKKNKKRKQRHNSGNAKQKSDRAPRDSKTVLQDLLSRKEAG